MKPLKLFYVLASLWVLVTLPACQIIKMLDNMMEQSKAISETIKQQTGDCPMVGYEINNGKTEISVYFNHLSNQQITVNELQSVIQQAVTQHLKKEPHSLVLIIQIGDTVPNVGGLANCEK